MLVMKYNMNDSKSRANWYTKKNQESKFYTNAINTLAYFSLFVFNYIIENPKEEEEVI